MLQAAMAGASSALSWSHSVQRPASYPYRLAKDDVSPSYAMTRIFVSKCCDSHLPRLRAHVPRSACFEKAPFSWNGNNSKSFRPSRYSWFPAAASSDDSYSANVKGTESDASSELPTEMQEPQEDSNRKASEVTDRVEQLQSDEVHEVGAEKEGSSEETKKFVEVLKETAEELKEQAEKAREAFAVTAEETAAILTARAQETAEKSKEGLSYIAENAPDPIREIADTALKAHPTETHKNFSKIHDFCLGIPYGSILVIGGLLSFMISGSTVAIRFGVILGGILLGFSVSSLRAWKEGKPTYAYIQGQAVISAILALRQMRRLLEVKTFFPTFIFTMISGAMLAFYSRMLLAGEDPPRKTQEPAP